MSPRTDPEPYSEVHSYFRGEYCLPGRCAPGRIFGYGRSVIEVTAFYAVSA